MSELTARDAGQQPVQTPETMGMDADNEHDPSVNPAANASTTPEHTQTSPAAERAAAAPDSDEITGATPQSKQSQI